jgi:predicted kinase
MNDLAFLIMDLDDRQQSPLAWRCLNRYLQHTGDYSGLTLLRFYKVYRALVRAKVDAIRLGQAHLSSEEQNKTRSDFLGYLELAESYSRASPVTLILTRGLSASGKTTCTQTLLEVLGAVRLRSDVERKRLFKECADLYSKDITQQVYQHLLQLAGELLAAAYPVIIDASFIDTEKISAFHSLASDMGIPFHILEFNARPDTLRNRIKLRETEYSDATLEVLEKQLQQWHAVPTKLQACLIPLDTEQDINFDALKGRLF